MDLSGVTADDAARLAQGMSPYGLLDGAFEHVGQGVLWAAAFGLAAGVVLGLAPVALPAVPAVAALVSPTLTDGTGRVRAALGSGPRVGAFVVGMDAPLTAAGYFLSEAAAALARASVVLALVTAVLLAAAGLWSLLRRGAACSRPRAIPSHPADAAAYGFVFGLSACSGCAPLLIGLGSAVALAAGPGTAVAVLIAFLVGRTVVLVAVAAAGGRLLARPGGARAFDTAIGVALLAASGYYLWLVATGRVSAVLPGEPGATLLP